MPHFRPAALAFIALALTTGGCSLLKPHDDTPKTGSLTQHFSLIDTEGRTYGTLELDPVSGGKVTDAQGRLIGYVTPPSQQPAAMTNPVTQPVELAPVPAVR